MPATTKLEPKWRRVWELLVRGGEERDLRGIDLRGAELALVRLQGAHFARADLRWAFLEKADLRGADLRGADLREADLRGADLTGVDLAHADLRRVRLTGAAYNSRARWPAGFDPAQHGAVLTPQAAQDPKPTPTRILHTALWAGLIVDEPLGGI
jgi:uncharacterized protein YjbI with pentapeptide repeats